MKTIVTFTALLFLLAPAAAFPAGNIHFGRTEVHPYVNLAYQYNDNVYLNDGAAIKEEDSWLMLYSLGVDLKHDRGEKVFTLGYGADIYRHSGESDADRESQQGSLSMDLKFPVGIDLQVGDTYIKTEEPANSELIGLHERTQNVFDAALGIGIFDRLKFRILYGRTDHDYEEDPLEPELEKLDRVEETWGGEFDLRILPKTSFYLGGSRSTTAYDAVVAGDLRDSEARRVTAGIRGQVSPKVRADLMAGYEEKDYDDPAKEDYTSAITGIGFNYDYSSFTKFTLKLQRRFTESFYTSTGGDAYNYYAESTAALAIDYRLTQKITSRLGLNYGLNDYNVASTGAERQDTLLGGELSLFYDIRPWLKTGVGYQYRKRDSDYDTEDYVNHRYSLMLNARF